MANRIALFGTGFLLCVLWMDLKFDSLAWGHGGDLPEDALASIAAYYNRVIPTDLGRFPLIAMVMVITLCATLWQSARGGIPPLMRIIVPALAWPPILLAMAWIVPNAAELGERTTSIAAQSATARGVFAAHAYCFVSLALLAVLEFHIARNTERD